MHIHDPHSHQKNIVLVYRSNTVLSCSASEFIVRINESEFCVFALIPFVVVSRCR